MSKNLEDLRARFQKWRSTIKGKGLKVNIGKIKIMVSGTENAIALSKIELCGILYAEKGRVYRSVLHTV